MNKFLPLAWPSHSYNNPSTVSRFAVNKYRNCRFIWKNHNSLSIAKDKIINKSQWFYPFTIAIGANILIAIAIAATIRATLSTLTALHFRNGAPPSPPNDQWFSSFAIAIGAKILIVDATLCSMGGVAHG